MWRIAALSFLAIITFNAAAVAGPLEKNVVSTPVAPPYDPLAHWEFDLETGVLWRWEHNGTPLNYVILPQMLSFRSPAVFQGNFAGGTLALRNRLSLAIEPIIEGPESYFIGATGSGVLEWWNMQRKVGLFLASGGGVGWMDSKGYEVEGAQGQDLNFTWHVMTGVRVMPREQMSISLSVLYQHISNRGQDDVNPGLDALGPMLSFGWHF